MFICIYAIIFAFLAEHFYCMSEWNKQVKGILKAEMVRRGISYSELVRLLRIIDIEETKSSIASKISRGTFSAAFFVQCLVAIGCERLEIQELKDTEAIAAEPKTKYSKA